MTTILIVEPVSSGNDLVVSATRCGWNVVVASFNAEDRTLTSETQRLASSIIEVDTNDALAVIDAIGKELGSDKLDGVVAGSEFHVEIVAEIAQKLGLPGLEPANVALVRNKAKMREALARNQVRSPGYREVFSGAQAAEASEQLTFPLVIKPTDSSGSIHVVKAHTRDEVVSAYGKIEADRTYDLGRQLGNAVVIEEYVEGDEYSADGYVWDGSVRVVAVTRKFLGPEPAFVELGHVTPAPLQPDEIRAIDLYVNQVVDAVSLRNSVFHCEIRMTADGPVLMEIAARLPGDQIVHLVAGATGVSLAEAALRMAVGDAPVSSDGDSAARGAVGIRFVDSGGLSVYEQIAGWEDIDDHIDVLDKKVLIPAGDKVPSDFDFRRRIAYVKYRATDPAVAMAINERLGRELRPIEGAS